MSLNPIINIVKGWPNPTIVEASLPVDSTVEGVLGQGEVVHIGTDRTWKRGIASMNTAPYIINVDSDDPSTARGAHKAGYVQIPWGGVHGIALNNPLEIETAFYKSDDDYDIGDPLSAPTGKIQKAQDTEVIIGTVSRKPYTLGNFTYLTFLAENGKRVQAD